MNAPHIFDLVRCCEKRCFPWMQSTEDRDLIAIIGTHQGTNKEGICCKQLYMTGIAPIATVQRRLRRLIKLGILQRRQSGRDARVFYVCLSDAAESSIESFAALLKRSALSVGNRSDFASQAPSIADGASRAVTASRDLSQVHALGDTVDK